MQRDPQPYINNGAMAYTPQAVAQYQNPTYDDYYGSMTNFNGVVGEGML